MRRLFAAPVLVILLVAARSDGAIVNGDFESVGSAGQYASLLLGGPSLDALSKGSWSVYNALPGWYNSYVPDDPNKTLTAGIEVQTDGVLSKPATDHTSGDNTWHYVELDSHATSNGNYTNSSMSQNITLSETGVYTIAFAYHARTDDVGDNGISVFLNALGSFPPPTSPAVYVVANNAYTNANGWQELQFDVDVAAGDYVLTFAAIGTQNTYGGLLDDISMTFDPNKESQIPEPATLAIWSIFGAGAAGAAAARRRRQRGWSVQNRQAIYQLIERSKL